jgi:hypothetical protein
LYTTKYPDENLTSNYIFDTKLEHRFQDQDQSICDGKVKGSPFLNIKDKTLVR